MPELVAIDMALGPAFVEALRRVWDDGDAALPLDERLPHTAKRRLLASLQPTAVIAADGDRIQLEGGKPVDPDTALVIATSGTTGEPKGVVPTHANVVAHAHAVHRRLGVDRARDRWVACLPPAHVGGLGVITRALIDDVPLDVLPRFDPDEVHSAAAEGATLVSLVPTALERLGNEDLFRWVVLGGGPDWHERPANVVHTYGSTESCGGVVYEDSPLDDVEVDLDNTGQILLRGSMIASHYRDGTPVTDEAGWYATGDIGERDAHGALHVLGRGDDMIVTGGENVWPGPVEAALSTHPQVADVAVAGVSDPKWGEIVVAFIVPTDDAYVTTLDELREHVKGSLPAYAAPHELVILGTLPKTALGKVRRDQLRM
jgi:O-succinylbenzoic acid--CoA ligase